MSWKEKDEGVGVGGGGGVIVVRLMSFSRPESVHERTNTICHLTIVNVCVIIILPTGSTQTSIPLLCSLYLFVELMITMNEYILYKPTNERTND